MSLRIVAFPLTSSNLSLVKKLIRINEDFNPDFTHANLAALTDTGAHFVGVMDETEDGKYKIMTAEEFEEKWKTIPDEYKTLHV